MHSRTLNLLIFLSAISVGYFGVASVRYFQTAEPTNPHLILSGYLINESLANDPIPAWYLVTENGNVYAIGDGAIPANIRTPVYIAAESKRLAKVWVTVEGDLYRLQRPGANSEGLLNYLFDSTIVSRSGTFIDYGAIDGEGCDHSYQADVSKLPPPGVGGGCGNGSSSGESGLRHRLRN